MCGETHSGERSPQLEAAKNQVFVDSNVDRIRVTTDRDYVAELNAFFKKRSRRLAR